MLSKKASFAESFLIHVAYKSQLCKAKNNNLEVQIMSLFGHYFSVLKLERQPDHVGLQPKAGSEGSSIPSEGFPPMALLWALSSISQSCRMLAGDVGRTRAAVLSALATYVFLDSTKHFCSTCYLW